MGSHRTTTRGRIRPSHDIPANPDNKGKTRRHRSIRGEWVEFTIEDEILRPQTGYDHKLIVFQKVRFSSDRRVEFRLGYYMLGVKPRMRGKWVWGQFCLFVPQADLEAILAEAKKRKWF